MSIKQWDAPKDPDEVKDYRVEWSDGLDGDTIASSSWSIGVADEAVGHELEVDSDSFAASSTTVWLSGGTTGLTYRLLNRITTAGGRTLDQTVKLVVRSK